MTETPTTTTTAPRFTRITRSAVLLGAPLPERLARTLPAKQRKDHAQLLERVEQASREIARLKNAIDKAPAADRAAASDAALRGEDLPESSEPRLRSELEQMVRAREALEDALRRSADLLLQGAAPKAEEVAGELERELGGLAEDVRARLADLTASIGELADLSAQAGWTRGLIHASGQSMSPFQGGRSPLFSSAVGEIGRVSEAFEFELGKVAERRREAAARYEEQARVRAGEEAKREEPGG
jgi:hypothetical protein